MRRIEADITKEIEKQSVINQKSAVDQINARDARLTQRDQGDLQVRAGTAAANNADALALEEAKRRTAFLEATTVVSRKDLIRNELNIAARKR